MSKYNNNFTIITPGGCNAKCDFCTDPMNYKPSENYLKNLMRVISIGLPDDFNQCSISGGEPTISKDLAAILTLVKFSNRFKKIVLTTNGTKLLEHVGIIGDCVDHVNVSRHGVGYDKNVGVFKNKQIINDEDLKTACTLLSMKGVDVNLNWVYTEIDNLAADSVLDFIQYAKSVNASKVTFRHDQNTNTLDETKLEKMFSSFVVVESGACPVCRSKTILVNGMPVTFKSSYQEPGNSVGELYELIYHPSGKLTEDWEGKREFKEPVPIPIHNSGFFDVLFNSPRTPSKGVSSGGCGSGGCG